jgi:membrane-associated phospholipid phosphatase
MTGIASSKRSEGPAWPSAEKCLLYFKVYVALNLLFIVVYGGANYLASTRAKTFRYYFDWERQIPFVPQLIYVYFSISLVFWLPLFFVDIQKIRRLGWMFALCIVVAGCFFLAVPGKTAFVLTPPAPSLGMPEGWLFAMLYLLDYPYNTLPSLHVALSTLTILAAIQTTASRWLGAGLSLWLLAIMLSVVLVHQHHLADVVTGMLLGWGCFRLYAAQHAFDVSVNG